jgi:hypothetical protein
MRSSGVNTTGKMVINVNLNGASLSTVAATASRGRGGFHGQRDRDCRLWPGHDGRVSCQCTGRPAVTVSRARRGVPA